jgi:hypothetical protein
VTAEQVAALTATESRDQFLSQFNRTGLESLLIYVSGYSPEAAAAALRHVTASLESHPGLYAADPAPPVPAPVIAGLPVPPLSAGITGAHAASMSPEDAAATVSA